MQGQSQQDQAIAISMLYRLGTAGQDGEMLFPEALSRANTLTHGNGQELLSKLMQQNLIRPVGGGAIGLVKLTDAGREALARGNIRATAQGTPTADESEGTHPPGAASGDLPSTRRPQEGEPVPPFDLTTLAMVGIANATVVDALRKTSEEVAIKAPSVKMTESGEILSGPDQRLSSGIYFPDGEPRAAIFVEKKDSPARYTAEDIAEKVSGQVNVVVRGSAQSLWPKDAIPRARDSLVRPGDSVSNYRGRAGTVGCLVTYEGRSASLRGFVGAAHVLGMLNTAAVGQEEDGDAIIRPGYPDGPKSVANRVGYLRDYSYLGHYQKRASKVITPNREDVGLVLFDDDIDSEELNLVPDPQDRQRRKRVIGVVPTEEILLYRGSRVYKIGRTSGLTEGTFSGIETTECPIRLPDGRIYIYSNVLQISAPPGRAFSEPGDSGALVYTQDLKGLGLIIGGNDRFAWASPLAICLETVSAQLIL